MTGRFTPITRKEILPRLGIKVDAIETECHDLGDTLARCLKMSVERLEETSEPDTDQRSVIDWLGHDD
jgi:hypothetical protein